MKHNLLKSVILSVILLMGVSNAWAWQSWHLYGNYQGSWNTNDKQNLSGTIENGKYFISVYHPGTTKYFRLYSNNHYGPNSSKELPSAGEQGGYNGESDSWYISYSKKGIIRICVDQTGENREWYPWVWWERSSDVRLKHQWSSEEWTYSATMNDGNDGTYTLTTRYPTKTGGYNYSDYSVNGSYDVGYIETPVIQGSPNAGDKCLFTLSTNTPSLTITRLYTIKYDGNGSTTGVPSEHDKKHGTNTALSSSTPTRTGYTFAGWNTKADGSGTNYAKGATYSDNADVTLYAKWTPIRCNITLTRGDGATGGSGYVYATYGSNILEPEIVNPTKTGHNFLGWSNQGGNVIVIDINGKLLPGRANGSLITYTDPNGNWAHTGTSSGLWAKWEVAKYNINYKDQGNANFSGTHASGYPTQHTYGKATSLLTATKTGYTFEGWFKNPECTGSAVTTLGSYAYTADITLYAKWTINQYTLTFGAGEGGSVTAIVDEKEISSPATLPYNTSVKLTATPEGKNAFAQWVNGNGNQVSTNNPYELTLTGNTTIKAEFTSPSKVYLKPFDFWKSDDARIAAYYWGAAGNNWIELSPVDCEGHYYSVDIPAGYSNIIFASLKTSSATGYDNNNKGFNWENSLYQTENLTVQTNGKNMYDSDDRSYIHLEPKAWDDGYARFAAYFYNNTSNEWVNLTKNSVNDKIYTGKIPQGKNYEHVIFCRMNINDQTNNFNVYWHKTKDLSLMDNGDNCFWVNTDGDWNSNKEQADGGWYRVLDNNQWKTYSAPNYTVTIKPTIHGTYSVVCNGRAYPVTYKEEIVIPNVPVGTILTIQDVKPNNAAEYTDNIIYKESANAAYQTLVGNQITVCGNTTIDENFVTKNTHVVYLRIPSGLEWGTGNHQKLSVYNKLTESYTPKPMTEANGTYEPGYKYYTCTIPTSTHTIRFEYNNQYQTHDFPHVMPLGSLNCYTIHSREGNTTVFNGYWSELLSNGDYRLLYVEQVVEKGTGENSWKTVITRKKAHPSDIIPASIISAGNSKVVSLHIFKDRTYTANAGGGKTYESSNNPEVILQQYNSSTNTWEDKECHMVFGPLKTLPGMAMAPGRRNAAADGKLVYDDGIEKIKNDDHPVHPGSGVWNFTVKQLEGNKATIDLTNVTRYTGEYYIRTDVANGGWFNYNPTNHMTRSDEAKANSNFSHYYCKWIGEAGVNVKFTVANDYGYAISDTLEADRTDLWGVALANKMVGDNQTLPEKANVRFAWNEYSNFIHRAYIAGSSTVSDRFLVLEGDANIFDANGSQLNVSGLDANQQIFRDNSNWIYYADVQMKPMAPVKVTAKYNGQTQYFVGKQDATVSLLQGSGSEKYLIRMLYDFKTNQLISAYVPGASNSVNAISTNLMLIRQNNNEATQLEFNNAAPHDMETIPTDRRAYGVIEFTKERLIDDSSLNPYERSLYWISFPFDVNVEEAICFGEYGKHWIIQEYNGARRAAEGCWLDSESFWDYKWDQNITLEAGKGYVLALDVDQIASDGLFGLAGNRPIGIYFPSTSYIDRAIMDLNKVSTTVEPLECTINRNTPKGDRRIADSHWNVIGVPSYRNTSATYSFADIATKPTEVKYYYRWDGNYNAYTAMETNGTQDFHSTHAYMVQFAGQINWTNIFNIHPAAIAAKQSSDDIKEHRLRLEILQNGNKADHTFVRLQDEDGVTDHFDFNHDLCKIINAGANIYSFVTTETYPIEVAANVLPIQETVIPVGVVISAAGEYTFAMPDGTDGIVVELIDYETNTRTNMLLDNYTVNLGKGTFENRFALHVQPSKVTTSVGEINTNTTGVKKYLIDGILYMQKDGVLYDAQGKLVR